MNRNSLLVAYSAIVCLFLLGLGGYCLSYEEWELPPQPALEEIWVGEDPFRLEPNRSVTAESMVNLK